MSLDDRLYCLQRTKLPEELSILLRQADRQYLIDHEEEAEDMISHIEQECCKRKVEIHNGQ